MSWSIVVFNSLQNILSVDKIDETQLVPTDFCTAFESYFGNITKDGNHREIKGDDLAIGYFVDEEPVSNKMLNLYGENGLYECVKLARKYNWQIFDAGLGQMIHLENPSINGYENFQSYLKDVLNQKG